MSKVVNKIEDLQGEVWREIRSTGGRYSVSNIGRVKSNGFYANVAGGGKRFVNPRILSLGKHSQGYYTAHLGSNNSNLVHRLVATEFHDNPKNFAFVNHKNGIKTDNRVENLEWCTRQENEDHAFRTGLKNSTGSKNVQAKITEKDVIFILENYGKISDDDLCNKFNIHRVTLQRIVNRKIWRHVKFGRKTKVVDTHKKKLFNTETGIYYDSMVEAMKTTTYKKSHFYAMMTGRNKNITPFVRV